MLPYILVDGKKVDEIIIRWLPDIYKEVVQPMTILLKQIMKDFYIVNEAELFCSDLEFKVSDAKITKRYIGDRARTSEDVRLCCNDRIQELIKQFRKQI